MKPATSLLGQFPQANEKRVAVRVSEDARRWIRSGHPWLYDDSILTVSEGGASGDLAVIFNKKREFLAIGLYDLDSPIRVRILHHGKPTAINDQWWRDRLQSVFALRSELLGSSETTGLRCINGENDGLPGLIVDKYEQVAVVKIYSAAWLPHLATVVPLLVQLLGAETVVLRLSRKTAEVVPAGIVDGMTIFGPAPTAPVLFRENGLTVEADVMAGQKTGYFLDQRDNRQLVRAASAGAHVLDVFSAGGGFTLAAAAGGAASVLSVDISGAALAAVKRNLGHNEDLPTVSDCRHNSVRGDAFEVMADLVTKRQRFDVVIVDPPAFAQNEASVPAALRAYGRLTELAVELVKPGGLLVQASCSSRVSADDFYDTVRSAAKRAGVHLEVLQHTGHALDHPIGFQHGEYLKAIFTRVHR